MNDNEDTREYPHEQPVPDNVRFHPSRCYRDLDPVSTLRAAHNAQLEHVIVIGMDAEGKEFMACSTASGYWGIAALMRGVHKLNGYTDEVQEEAFSPQPPTKRGA